jgi:hypothetical protein
MKFLIVERNKYNKREVDKGIKEQITKNKDKWKKYINVESYRQNQII